MTKPWVRLYRAEGRAFSGLSLYARALAAELLKLTDDDGIILLGGRAPHEAIAWQLGANRSDRRLLRGHLEELLRDGYIVLEGDTLRVPGFPRFQRDGSTPEQRSDRTRAANEPRSIHDGAANKPRPNHEATTTEQRSDHETEAKCAESRGGTECALKDQIRDTERDTEVEVERGRATRPLKRFDVLAYHADHPVVVAVLETWQREYARAFGKAYVPRGHGDALAAARLAHWCELHAAATGDPDTEVAAREVAARVVRHFVAAKHAAGGTPPAQTWLDPDGVHYPLDPAAYLSPPVARPVRRGGRGAPTGMLPVSTDFGPAPEESDIETLFA